MIAMTIPLLVVPLLAAGYSVMFLSMLAAASVVVWDAMRLFSGRAASQSAKAMSGPPATATAPSTESTR